jgi:hypothetical protein
MDSCRTCGTPKSINRFGQSDCSKCNSENFVDFPPPRAKTFVPPKNQFNDVVVSHFVEGQGIEVLEEIEE